MSLIKRASDDEVMITRLLEKSIRRTEAVDREALCILAGEKVSSDLQLSMLARLIDRSGNYASHCTSSMIRETCWIVVP